MVRPLWRAAAPLSRGSRLLHGSLPFGESGAIHGHEIPDGRAVLPPVEVGGGAAGHLGSRVEIAAVGAVDLEAVDDCRLRDPVGAVRHQVDGEDVVAEGDRREGRHDPDRLEAHDLHLPVLPGARVVDQDGAGREGARGDRVAAVDRTRAHVGACGRRRNGGGVGAPQVLAGDAPIRLGQARLVVDRARDVACAVLELGVDGLEVVQGHEVPRRARPAARVGLPVRPGRCSGVVHSPLDDPGQVVGDVEVQVRVRVGGGRQVARFDVEVSARRRDVVHDAVVHDGRDVARRVPDLRVCVLRPLGGRAAVGRRRDVPARSRRAVGLPAGPGRGVVGEAHLVEAAARRRVARCQGDRNRSAVGVGRACVEAHRGRGSDRVVDDGVGGRVRHRAAVAERVLDLHVDGLGALARGAAVARDHAPRRLGGRVGLPAAPRRCRCSRSASAAGSRHRRCPKPTG